MADIIRDKPLGRVITVQTPANTSESASILSGLLYQVRILNDSEKRLGNFVQMVSQERKRENGEKYISHQIFTNGDAARGEAIRGRISETVFDGDVVSQSGNSRMSAQKGFGAQAFGTDRFDGDEIAARRFDRIHTSIGNKRSRAAMQWYGFNNGYRVNIDKNTGETDIWAMPATTAMKKKRAAHMEALIAEAHGRDAEVESMRIERIDNKHLKRLEQIPGAKEFDDRVNKGLDRQAAVRAARINWAKKHPRSPLAKSILKHERDKTAGGKMLNRAGTLARGAIITGIFAAMGVAVKFLSSLPGLASDIRKMSAKGESLNMTDEVLRGWKRIEEMAVMPEGTTGEFYGSLRSQLASVVSDGGNLSSVIKGIAVLASRTPGPGADLIGNIVDYKIGKSDDLGGLGKNILNTALVATLNGVTDNALQNPNGDTSTRWLRNSSVVGKDFSRAAEYLDGLKKLFFDDEIINAVGRQTIRDVASGSGAKINGTAVAAYDVLGAITAFLGEGKDTVGTKDTATIVEWKAADDVASSWKKLAQDFQNIKDGIKAQIIAATEPLIPWLRQILKAILSLPVFNGKYDAVIRGMDEQDYAANVSNKVLVDVDVKMAQALAEKMGSGFGYTNDEQLQEAYTRFARHEGIPDNVPMERLEEHTKFINTLILLNDVLVPAQKRLEFQNSKFENQYQEHLNPDTGKMEKYGVGNVSLVPRTTSATEAAMMRSKYHEYNYPFLKAVDEVAGMNLAQQGALVSKAEKARDEAKGKHDAAVNFEILAKKHPMLAATSPLSMLRPEQTKKELDQAEAHYQQLKNAVIFSYAAMFDGMSFGKPVDAYSTPLVRGEAGVVADGFGRKAQAELAAIMESMREILAQAGINVVDSVLRGEVQVSGTIKAEDRTYTILLKDALTGELLHKIEDIQNISVKTDMTAQRLGFEAFLNRSRPTKRPPLTKPPERKGN